MANEDEEMFVPAYKKYAEMQDAILAGIDKVHARFKKLNADVGAEWIQPKAGPSKLSRLSGYLKKKYGNLKTRVEMYGEPKTHFEPVYSEAEKREREEWKEDFRGFEEYNPKDSKKYGVKDRLKDIGAAIAKVKLGYGDTEDKLENYEELPGFNVSDEFLREYDAKKAMEKAEFDKVPLEESAEGLKLRKSYGLEAHRDKLLRRSKINDISQYAPERSGR